MSQSTKTTVRVGPTLFSCFCARDFFFSLFRFLHNCSPVINCRHHHHHHHHHHGNGRKKRHKRKILLHDLDEQVVKVTKLVDPFFFLGNLFCVLHFTQIVNWWFKMIENWFSYSKWNVSEPNVNFSQYLIKAQLNIATTFLSILKIQNFSVELKTLQFIYGIKTVVSFPFVSLSLVILHSVP